MNTRRVNERCPLQAECERRCDYEFRENECDYYRGNARPGCMIDGFTTATYEIPVDVEENTGNEEETPSGDEGGLVYIPVGRLHPHPDNPRKNIGDISELTESIRENGIFQNLTVVPDDPDSSITEFTVIIGHRRLAAAIAAGLESVPCVVARMTKDEELTTMLAENMQRVDLTVYEQAKAFQQLSLDLGMTVQEIAAKSGFSETTVRKRTKLAELDENSFKNACSRGATLFDFAELDKIEDPEAKKTCLDAIGTQNFKNVLKAQLDAQRNKKKMEKWISQLEEFATRIEQKNYVGGEEDGEFVEMNYFRNYGSWTKAEDVEKPEDADEIRYFFRVSSNQIDIYREAVENSEKEEERRKEEEIRHRDEAAWHSMKEMQTRHKELRRDFVLNYGAAKSNIAVIMRNLADAMVWEAERNYYSNLNTADLCKMLGISFDEETRKPDKQEFKRVKVEQPERTMLILAYWYMDKYGDYAKHDWRSDIQRWVIRYNDNQKLDDLYYFLEELGYERSDEERQLSNGTHQLFEDPDGSSKDGG